MGTAIRLVVLDIDGTISGHSNQVSAVVKQAVKDAQSIGIRVAIATGRMYRSALRFHESIGSDCPLISYQGAFIKDPQTAELVGHWPVDINHALALVDDFSQLPFSDRLSTHIYIDDKLFVREITPQSAIYAQRSGVEPIPVGNLREFLLTNQHNPPTKVLVLSDNPEEITIMFEQLKQKYPTGELYLTKSQATFFEATNPIANKGTAVQHLAETILGFDRSEVMTVGDNMNDVEMIEYAGIGVAMGNAPQALQDLANWVAPDVDHDGAAVAIAKFVLN